jgi:hypothetical protein
MKKTLATMVVAAAVVLLTATFSFAEFAVAGGNSFPYFQLGCLIVGGLVIVSLKHKYEKCTSTRRSAHSPSTPS